MPKNLNYVSLKESHKEIASLLESPSPLIFINQQHQQQQQQQQNCNSMEISAVNAQFQEVNDSTNLCSNLILNNANNINKSQIVEMSQKFDTTSLIMDQIRQQLLRFPNQTFNNNFNITTTNTATPTLNTATVAAIAAANALKNYCLNTDDENLNRLNSLNNFSDEPLNLCIREQY